MSVTDTFDHGSIVTIIALTFGAKGGTNPNKPLIWADFENSINPTNLGHLTMWVIGDGVTLHRGSPQNGLFSKNMVGTL